MVASVAEESRVCEGGGSSLALKVSSKPHEEASLILEGGAELVQKKERGRGAWVAQSVSYSFCLFTSGKK